MNHWIDNADSYICPICGFETNNPNRYESARCPKCGFQDVKDVIQDAKNVIMNKAILVIDMPKHCGECPICEVWEAIPSCEEYYCNAAKNDNVDQYKRPDWCPLKPMPRMRFTYIGHDGEATANYNRGWNDCIEKIKGE